MIAASVVLRFAGIATLGMGLACANAARAQEQMPWGGAVPSQGAYAGQGYQGQPYQTQGYQDNGASNYGRSPYAPPPAYGQAPHPQAAPQGGYGGGQGQGYSAQGPSRGTANDAYSPSGNAYGGQGYADQGYGGSAPGRPNDAYSPSQQQGYGPRDSYSDPGQPYGAPYARAPENGYPEAVPPERSGTASVYEEGEVIRAGHGFFGAVSKSLAQAVEYVFRSQGRPNGYILGEDAGGAFVVGLRYGEGKLFTKDAGDHKVYWQGPSFGYDAGAEGSKTMVLVYNMKDPSEIYERFGGVQGAAYLVGGLSVQIQKCNDVTLAVIRSGVGLRLGANVGYLHYTRSPTWNPL